MLASWHLALVLFVTPAIASLRRYTFNIVNNAVAPDGGPLRDAVLVNGQVPGTLITGKVGDTLQVKVVNKLTDTNMTQGVSIHWHGLFQYRNAENDGVTWVTQCPISPKETFTYNMTLDQSGTYWYHSHIATQYCDGFVGGLVIYDPHDPLKHHYDVDDENTVITIGDWIHLPSPQSFQAFGDPDATLINGLGRLPGKSKSPLSVVQVEKGLRYRMRVINTACMSAFNFSIDGHTMSLIEVDGTETVPGKQFSAFSLYPGQRASLVLKADKPVGNYWIRAVPFFVTVHTPPVLLNTTQPGVNMAILRYHGAPKKEPTTDQTHFDIAPEQSFKPLERLKNISGTPDVSLVLNIGVNEKKFFTINGNLFEPPSVPVLLQILNGINPFHLMPHGSVIPLPANSLIELTIPGGSPFAPHPFHLHGHKFAVIRSAESTAVHKHNPPLRDVVNTGKFLSDNVTIRFRTDNPGPWIFHCHIDFHLEAALALVFAESTQAQISGPDSEIITESWKKLCPKWNALKSGKQFSVDDFH